MKDGNPGIAPDLDATGMRVGVVASRFNEEIVTRLVDGACEALTTHGADAESIDVVWVPGAFELPIVLRRLAATGRYDALVALGAVVRGETPHFEFVSAAATDGIAIVARDVPVGFGLLTTETTDQAMDRAGGSAGNKGAEAALSAVEVATLLRDI